MHKLAATHPAGSAQPCPAGKEREMVGVWRESFAFGETASNMPQAYLWGGANIAKQYLKRFHRR